MKKIFLSAAFILTVAAGTSFATEDPVTGDEAKETFAKEFAGAESAVWKQSGDYFKVNFIFRGYRTEAYFNKEGGLEGSVRSLLYDQLPLTIVTSVNKRFADADVLDVYEINNAEGTVYRITLKRDSKKIRVKLDPAGNMLEKEKLKN